MSEIGERLIDFARWVIEEHRTECDDLDGASIQDKLVELGLLHEVTVNGPCGENCRCAEYWDEWPNQCLRLVDGVLLEKEKVREE